MPRSHDDLPHPGWRDHSKIESSDTGASVSRKSAGIELQSRPPPDGGALRPGLPWAVIVVAWASSPRTRASCLLCGVGFQPAFPEASCLLCGVGFQPAFPEAPCLPCGVGLLAASGRGDAAPETSGRWPSPPSHPRPRPQVVSDAGFTARELGHLARVFASRSALDVQAGSLRYNGPARMATQEGGSQDGYPTRKPPRVAPGRLFVAQASCLPCGVGFQPANSGILPAL